MATQRITIFKSNDTTNGFDLDIPEEAGTYNLSFTRENNAGTINAGNFIVDDTERTYQLKLALSNGQEVVAGTFKTQVASDPITTLTLTQTVDAEYQPFLNYICAGERPVIKLNGELLTEYQTYPFATESDNNNILSVALPFPFPQGTHTITLEGGGPIYFGNYKFGEPMPTEISKFVGTIANHNVPTNMNQCTMISNITFGSNYGDTIGAGAFRNIPMTEFRLPQKITKLGQESIAIGMLTQSAVARTIWLHNKIEHMDTILDPTLISQTYNVYFPYSESDEVLFDPTITLAKGDDKATMTYNIYTDNSIIKNGILSIVDEYTIVNVYHYDGTAWE